MTGSFALAWRLQRANLVAWTVGVAVYAAAIGGIADGVGALVNSSSGTRDIIVKMGGRHGLVDAFLATTMGILGLAAAAYVVQTLLRLRTEETDQRAELVLAGSVSRWRWVGGHTVIAVGGAAVLLAVGGVAAGITHGIRAHDLAGELPRVLGAALVQLPAAGVLAGATLLLFGALPRVVAVVLGAARGVPASRSTRACARSARLGGGPFAVHPRTEAARRHADAHPSCLVDRGGRALGVAGFAGVQHRDIG